MISEDIKIIDLDATHWANLIKLTRGDFYEHRGGKGDKDAAARLTIIHQDGRALKALHSRKGVIRDFDFPGPDRLEELAQREDVKGIFLVARGAPRRLMHEVQSRLSLDNNIVAQGLEIYECVRERFDAGDFALWPPRPLREVKYSAVQTILKMAVPSGEAVVIVVFDPEGKIRDLSGLPILTSLVLRLDKKYELELITTTDGLAGQGVEGINNWRKDYKKIIDAAKKTWGKIFLGFFADVEGMAILDRTHPTKQAKVLLELEKEKKIILDPFPMRLKMMLKMGGLAGGMMK